MKRYLYFFFDIACVLIALLVALYIRNGISFIEEPQPYDLLKVVSVTALAAISVLTLFNTYTSMWRFTSFRDLRNVVLGITLVVLLSNGALFILDRLEVMPRSVPPMHWAFCVLSMCGSRLLARKIFGPIVLRAETERQHVLIIGANHITELYLEFAQKILHGNIVVEGILDQNEQLHNRAFHKYTILGNVESVPELLERFLVHGIRIDQIVLTHPFFDLSKSAQRVLTKLVNDRSLKLVHFSEDILPIDPAYNSTTSLPAVSDFDETISTNSYTTVKRLIDITGAIALFLLLSPVIILTALFVLMDVGFPVLFWQQRPGYRGKSFRLHKFRTMRHTRRRLDQERLEHKADDSKRISTIGNAIRTLRLDELPQLYHILMGQMSFIGPRPLLIEDQPEEGIVRLSVRPGITGWAQIHGGDELTPEQKLVLDHWYIKNLSLWLDIRIAVKTVIVLFRGVKPELDVVDQCRTIRFKEPHSEERHSA